MDIDNEIKKWIYFLKYKYNNVNEGSILSRILPNHPEYKKNINELREKIKKIIEELKDIDKDKAYEILKNNYPELLEEKKKEEKKGLEDINIKQTNTRFAPNPSGYLHLGHARAIILNYYYAKKYNGKFVLRIEDTDPKVKKPLIEVYDKIKEDTEWLINDKVDEFYIQSERLEIYYEYIFKLLEKGHAYIDLCDQKTISENRKIGKACEHREKDINWNLEEFDKLLNGEYDEGQAVIRIKTDINDPNPSVRDWIAFRIVNPKKNPHPWLLDKFGQNFAEKFYLWPTYNFASVIDDHLMGIKLILRMKEHEVNKYKQKYLYKYFNWEEPIIINYGALLVKDLPLHKSEIRKLINEGKISGWDDPFIPTLRGLKRRGIQPEAIKKYILEIGINPVEATVDWNKIYKYNKEIIDNKSKRLFVIKDPIKIIIENLEESDVTIKNHPKEDLGERKYHIKSNIFYIERNDINNKYLRLMDYINIEIKEKIDDNTYKAIIIGKTYEEFKKYNGKIIQWINDDYKKEIEILEPFKKIKALAESYIDEIKDGEIFQAIRYAFLKREKDHFIYVHP